MGKILSFEDIESWKKARLLVKEIYRITGRGDFSKDFSLRDQIRKSAISVMSNIAEGFGRQTKKEFIHFLYIAHGSVEEVKSQLYAALDINYIVKETFDFIFPLCSECSKLIMGFIRYLKTNSQNE